MNRSTAIDDGRGRKARRPTEIKKAGWRDVLLRSKSQIRGFRTSVRHSRLGGDRCASAAPAPVR